VKVPVAFVGFTNSAATFFSSSYPSTITGLVA